MKTLLKFAIGAAIGSALVHLLMNWSSDEETLDTGVDASGPPLESASGDAPASSADELVADTNMVANGDAAREQRAPQPQDWRGAQNVLDS
jgi:hypothetical protein